VLEADWYEYEGPVAEAKGGGGHTTTTTTAQPPAFQIPFIQNVLNAAQDRFNAPGPSFFPGSTVAPINPTLQQGLDTTLAGAQGAQNIANGAQGTSNFFLGPQGADPRSNPFFQGTLDAITNQASKAFQQNVLPQIDVGAVAAGSFGGSRQGVAQGQAADAFSNNLIDRLTAFGSNAFQQGQTNQLRALALAPQTAQLQQLPGQVQSGVGDFLRNFQQQGINEAIDRFNFNQSLPDRKLAQFAGLVGNPLGTAQTTVAPGAKKSPISGVLGGAVTGGVLGSLIPGIGAGTGIGLAGALGPAGIVGAGLGAALGLFG